MGNQMNKWRLALELKRCDYLTYEEMMIRLGKQLGKMNNYDASSFQSLFKSYEWQWKGGDLVALNGEEKYMNETKTRMK